MPNATNTFHYGDIPLFYHEAWKLIHKAEHQAMLAVKTASPPEAVEAYTVKAAKLASQALRSLPGDFLLLYGENRLAKAIFERAEAKYLKHMGSKATPRPELVQEQPKTVRLTIKIPPAHKRLLNARTPSPDSGNASSSSSGPERSELGYRTQRSSPYQKPAPRARAPRDRAPYRNSAAAVDASVDALASVLQGARISPDAAATHTSILGRSVRTIPAGYDMDALAAALAASNFTKTDAVPTARAYPSASSSAAVAVHAAMAPAPAPPSPSSSSSESGSENATSARTMDWAAVRRLKARRAILPVDSAPSPAARRREGRFNPLDRSARGTERTKERS